MTEDRRQTSPGRAARVLHGPVNSLERRCVRWYTSVSSVKRFEGIADFCPTVLMTGVVMLDP